MWFETDFGFLKKNASYEEAKNVLFFACDCDQSKTGQIPGPTAVLDASRYVNLFEVQEDNDPLAEGIYSEIVTGTSFLDESVKRANEIIDSGRCPIIAADDRKLTRKYCKHPLVALWGKSGRKGIDEASLLSKNTAILAGVRAATSNAFKSIPGQVAILTARGLSSNPEILKSALQRMDRPVHLSIDLDVLAPGIVQSSRSLEPGGLSWYELIDTVEIIFSSVRVSAVEFVGLRSVFPRTPAAMVAVQIMYKLAGIIIRKIT